MFQRTYVFINNSGCYCIFCAEEGVSVGFYKINVHIHMWTWILISGVYLLKYRKGRAMRIQKSRSVMTQAYVINGTFSFFIYFFSFLNSLFAQLIKGKKEFRVSAVYSRYCLNTFEHRTKLLLLYVRQKEGCWFTADGLIHPLSLWLPGRRLHHKMLRIHIAAQQHSIFSSVVCSTGRRRIRRGLNSSTSRNSNPKNKHERVMEALHVGWQQEFAARGRKV